MPAENMKHLIKEILAARDGLYAKLQDHARNMKAEDLNVDAETIGLLKELSDDRFSFRDMARTLLERACGIKDNAACKKLLRNIIEEDVHG